MHDIEQGEGVGDAIIGMISLAVLVVVALMALVAVTVALTVAASPATHPITPPVVECVDDIRGRTVCDWTRPARQPEVE